jgi:hypothetical protein
MRAATLFGLLGAGLSGVLALPGPVAVGKSWNTCTKSQSLIEKKAQVLKSDAKGLYAARDLIVFPKINWFMILSRTLAAVSQEKDLDLSNEPSIQPVRQSDARQVTTNTSTRKQNSALARRTNAP